MNRDVFRLINKDNETLLGYAWTVEKPVANLIISTGMEEHALRYDEFAKYLNDNNVNVYCLDHFGQGLNAKEEKDLGIVPKRFFSKSIDNIECLVRKLKESLLPICIFSHSMGSFLIQDYIQRYAGHVDKVIFCGTNGPNAKFLYKIGNFATSLTTNKRNYNKKSHSLNEIIFGNYVKSVKKHETNYDWLSFNKDNIKKYIDDYQCGYCSTHGFYREFMKGCNRLYVRKYLKRIDRNTHILIIGGSDDVVGNFGKGIVALEKLYKKIGVNNIKSIIYPNMRHEILNENNKEIVFEDILSFLKD